jgi:hypothetical protein
VLVLAEAVDWESLLEVVWTSAVAGIGVTAIFSIALFGATRAIDLSRDGRGVAATISGLVGLVGIAAVGAAIVLGILVMTSK